MECLDKMGKIWYNYFNKIKKYEYIGFVCMSSNLRKEIMYGNKIP